MLFSSDTGIVKPSPKPFRKALGQMGLSPDEALVVGDSERRDLGGARAASIACVLVVGAQSAESYSSAADIVELSKMCSQI